MGQEGRGLKQSRNLRASYKFDPKGEKEGRKLLQCFEEQRGTYAA